MLDHPFERLEGEVESVELGIALLELGEDAEGLQIVVEPAPGRERGIERPLAGMAEGAVAEVVGERHGFGEILVDRERAGERAGDLRHLEAVGEAGAVMIAFEIGEHLRLVLEAAEGRRMHDAVAIALPAAAVGALWFGHRAAEARLGPTGPGGEVPPHRDLLRTRTAGTARSRFDKRGLALRSLGQVGSG